MAKDIVFKKSKEFSDKKLAIAKLIQTLIFDGNLEICLA